MVERAPTGATLRHGRFGQQKRSDHQRDEITQFHSRRSSGPPSASSDPGQRVARILDCPDAVAVRGNRLTSPSEVEATETAASDIFGGTAAPSGPSLNCRPLSGVMENQKKYLSNNQPTGGDVRGPCGTFRGHRSDPLCPDPKCGCLAAPGC